jgi:hypothetical protein
MQSGSSPVLALAGLATLLFFFAKGRKRAPLKPFKPSREDDYRMLGIQTLVEMQDGFLKIKERCPYKVIVSLTSSPIRL